MLVCDSMVIIHLAKTTLLRPACQHFGKLAIPRAVYGEVVDAGRAKGYADALLVDELVRSKHIAVVDVRSEAGRLKLLEKFNVEGGEAEAVALALREGALLACDDGSVRSKAHVLGVKVVSTPAVLVALVKRGGVPKEKVLEAVAVLRKVGWFSSAVLDEVVLEVR